MHSIAVIGGGNEMENLKIKRKELGVEKTFILLDSQKNPWPYVKSADYFVLPSNQKLSFNHWRSNGTTQTDYFYQRWRNS